MWMEEERMSLYVGSFKPVEKKAADGSGREKVYS